MWYAQKHVHLDRDEWRIVLQKQVKQHAADEHDNGELSLMESEGIVKEVRSLIY